MSGTYRPSIRAELDAWAEWSRVGAPRASGYPSKSHFCPDTSKSPEMTDDRAIKIDAAVSRLRTESPALARVLVARYLNGRSLTSIGKSSAGNGAALGAMNASMMLRSAEERLKEYLRDIDSPDTITK